MVAARKNPYQLLIADDDPGFRSALRTIFEPHFEMVEASSGEEAIRIVEFRPVDIALVDMHMQVLTGLETLRILKSRNSIAPCILITADASEELRRDAAQSDAYSVLRKPVTKSELVSTVSTALADVYEDPETSAWFAD